MESNQGTPGDPAKPTSDPERENQAARKGGQPVDDPDRIGSASPQDDIESEADDDDAESLDNPDQGKSRPM